MRLWRKVYDLWQTSRTYEALFSCPKTEKEIGMLFIGMLFKTSEIMISGVAHLDQINICDGTIRLK